MSTGLSLRDFIGGIKLDGGVSLIAVDGLPGSGFDNFSDPANPGSIAADKTTGLVYRKHTAGTGFDKWELFGSGSGGGGGSLFFTDVTPTTSGIVGFKTFVPGTIPANVDILEATTDTSQVTIHFIAEGAASEYTPTIIIDGILATNLVQDPEDVRTYYGSVDITVNSTRVVTGTSSSGPQDSVIINLAGAGPSIQSIVFGALPGVQTEVKENDTVPVTVVVPNTAVNVDFSVFGAVKADSLVVGAIDSAGVGFKLVTGDVTVSGNTGALTAKATAFNLLGTPGPEFESAGTLPLNQTYPQIIFNSIGYPGGQGAFGASQNGGTDITVTNFNTVNYSSPNFSITSPSTYAQIKSIQHTSGTYVASGTNYNVTANRAANDATTELDILILIATVAPTADISIDGSPAYLTASPTGNDYTVRISPDQTLNAAPSLNASIGTFIGSWSQSGSDWIRTLRIQDGDGTGTGVFSGLSMTNLAGIVGTVINSGSTYEVAGFSLRTVQFPAFARHAAIGTSVANVNNVNVVLTGSSQVWQFRPNTDNVDTLPPSFSIVNAAGTYDPTGNYLLISSITFAGSNTTGLFKLDIEEVT